MPRLIIELDEDHSTSDTLAEVQRLIEEGNTEGYHPRWFIEDDDG